MPRPKEYDDALRVRLVEAAAHVLGEEGPHAMSVRRVAGECGTSTTAIYTLIGGKDELVREIYREGFRRLKSMLEAVELTDDPETDLFHLGLAYHRNGIENPDLYRVMFDCPIPEFEANPEDVAFGLSTLQTLVEAVTRCVDAGLLVGDPWDLSLELWAMNHGITSLAITGTLGEPDEARRRAEHAIRSMAIGYMPAPAPR